MSNRVITGHGICLSTLSSTTMDATNAFRLFTLQPFMNRWKRFAEHDPEVAALVAPSYRTEGDSDFTITKDVFRKEALQVFNEHGYLKCFSSMGFVSTDLCQTVIMCSLNADQAIESLTYLVDLGFTLKSRHLIEFTVWFYKDNNWPLCRRLYRELSDCLITDCAWYEFLNKIEDNSITNASDGVSFFLENGFVPTPENTPYFGPNYIAFSPFRFRFIHVVFGFPIPSLTDVFDCIINQPDQKQIECIVEFYGASALNVVAFSESPSSSDGDIDM